LQTIAAPHEQRSYHIARALSVVIDRFSLALRSMLDLPEQGADRRIATEALVQVGYNQGKVMYWFI